MAITIETINVTPEMARSYLLHNVSNRNLSQRIVDKYATDMKNGDWKTTGETIVFYEDGTLKDGQHRLTAVIKANVTVPMVIVHGIPLNVKIHDVGAKRTTSDIMAIEGYEASLRSNNLIAGVNFLIRKYTGKQPTTSQTMKFINQHSGMLVDCDFATRSGAHRPICRKSSILAAAFCENFYGVDAQTIIRFFQIANTGFSTTEYDSSAIVLRNFLLNPLKYDGSLASSTGGLRFQNKSFEVCIRAIGDFSSGKPRRQFYFSKEETAQEKYLKEHAFSCISREE